MFISSLAAWEIDKKYLPCIFKHAINFIQSINSEAIIPGTYPIQGNDIFAKIECGAGRTESERRFELHHKYIDVQILLSGNERQDYALTYYKLEEDRPEEDISFYSVTSNIGTVYLQPKDYTLYFPGELHAPSMGVNKTSFYKKAIIKINSQLI